MKHAARAIAVGVLVMVSSVAAAERPSIHGTVVDEQGRAIPDAVVAVHTAKPRTGTIPYCPSCYADCRKQATTNEAGHFAILALNPKLLFRLLIVAEGHSPRFVSNVDPAKGPIDVSLSRIAAERLLPGRIMKGRVRDPHGKPVAGATITPFAVEQRPDTKSIPSNDADPFDHGLEPDEQGNWGLKRKRSSAHVAPPRIRLIRPNEVDPLAVTNEQGEFYLTSESSDVGVRVTVRAHGLAALPCYTLHTASQTHDIRLDRGATVRGRLMHGSTPVGGVVLGVIQKNRTHGVGFLREYTATTDADGSFHLYNLPPNMDYYIYGKMESLQDKGALSDRQFRTGDHGSQHNLGELVLEQAHHVSGRVVLSDGQRIPNGTHLLFSREKAWDSQIIELDANGCFTAKGISREVISIHLRVPGYRLAKNAPSLDPLSGSSLIGSVVQSIDDFLIELEAGEAIETDPVRQRWEENRRKRAMPLRGATVASTRKPGERRASVDAAARRD